jgi:hypothetical protein
VNIHDMINVYITGESGSEMTHIINGTGNTLNTGVTTATANCLWSNPGFSMSAASTVGNMALSFPTESAHSYQLQYKNALTDSTWSSLGAFFDGDDTLDTVNVSPSSTNSFYRVQEH